MDGISLAQQRHHKQRMADMDAALDRLRAAELDQAALVNRLEVLVEKLEAMATVPVVGQDALPESYRLQAMTDGDAPKRRGRPPGSRNKPRTDDAA